MLKDFKNNLNTWLQKYNKILLISNCKNKLTQLAFFRKKSKNSFTKKP